MLECRHKNRIHACIDLAVSQLQAAAEFPAPQLTTVSDEFVVAFLWDIDANFTNIGSILPKIAQEFSIATRTGKYSKAHLHRLILSKGAISVLVEPEISGKVRVLAGGMALFMTWQELGKMAIEWELRPDLGFFTTIGTAMVPSGVTWKTLTDSMESIELQEDFPFIQIGDEEIKEASEEKTPENGGNKHESQVFDEKQAPSSSLNTCLTCNREISGSSCIYCRPVERNLGQDFESPEISTKYKTKITEKSTEWTCICGETNYSMSRVTCIKCRKARSEPAIPIDKQGWKCAKCDSWNREDTKRCEVCAQDRHPSQWICGKCQKKNSESVSYCLACYTSRREETTVKAKNAGTGKKTPDATPPDRTSTTLKTSPRQVPDTLSTPPDKWTCKSCGYLNNKYREICLKCRKSKETVTSVPKPTCPKCGTVLNSDLECAICIAAVSLSQKSMQVTPSKYTTIDNWTCTYCKNRTNFANESTCFRCQMRRDVVPDRPSTWKCPSCDGINLSSDAVCSYCRIRPTISAKIDINAALKWRCSYCSVENFADRSFCKQCYKSKDKPEPVPKPAVTTSPQPKPAFQYSKMSIERAYDRRCECGAVLINHETKCGTCEAKVVSPSILQGKDWRCTQCGEENKAGREKCLFCFKMRNSGNSGKKSIGKCEKCGRIVSDGEGMCSYCRSAKQSPSTAKERWVCKACAHPNRIGSVRCLACTALRT